MLVSCSTSWPPNTCQPLYFSFTAPVEVIKYQRMLINAKDKLQSTTSGSHFVTLRMNMLGYSSKEDGLGVCSEQRPTITHGMDGQQVPTVQQRKLYSISWDTPEWKRVLSNEHICVLLSFQPETESFLSWNYRLSSG